MNSLFNYLRFFPRFFCKRGLPAQLIFFVTSQCNLRCRHCFYWKEVDSKKNEELSLAEIKKFTNKSKLNLLWLSLTGGEPFLRLDLPEIARSFYKNGKVLNISIPTNAQLKKQTIDVTKKIINFCPGSYIMIAISLDGLEKVHDNIRRSPGSFSKAIETFEELKKLKRYKNFGLSIQATMMEANQDKISELYVFARDKLKPDYINLNILRGDPYDKKMKNIKIEYYEELSKIMYKDVLDNKWPYFNFALSKLALKRNFEVYKRVSDTYRNNHFTKPCYAINLSGVLDERGNVFPCEILKNALVGNLRGNDYDFRKIWFSEYADELRKKISNKCFCTYECALSMNTLFDLNFYKQFL